KPEGGTEEIATLNDGLKFEGNTGPVIAKKLNQTLAIKGGLADAAEASSENIRVDSENGELVLKLAKSLTGLTSVTTETLIAGGHTIDNTEINLGGNVYTNINQAINYIGDVAQATDERAVKYDLDPTGAINYNSITLGGVGATTTTKITNLTNADLTATSTDAVTGQQLYATNQQVTQNTTNISNISDIVGGGFNVSAQGGTKDNVKLGETVDFNNTDGNIVVTNPANNSLSFNLAKDLSGLTSITLGDTVTNQTVIKQGSVTTNNLTVTGETKLGDNFHVTNEGDVHYTGPVTENTHIVNKQYVDQYVSGEAGGGFGLSDDAGNAFMQDLGKAAQIIGDGSIATSVVDTATGKALQVSLSSDISVGAPGKDGKDGTIGVHGKDGSSVVINGKDGSIGANGADGKHGVSINGKDGTIGLTGLAGTTTIRIEPGKPALDGKDGLTRIQYVDPDGNNHEVATMEDGLKFAGNVGTVSAKLGETVNVVGGAARADSTYSTTNVTTVASGNTVEVRMADSPKFTGEVQADGGVSISEHLTVNPGTTVNMGGNQITNMGAGTADDHAATVGQVKNMVQNINNGYGELSRAIEKNRRDANAGTAAAMAIAGLGQPYQAGQSMVSLGTGVWRGQTGYAVGVSSISDNGKWLLKGAVTGSDRGGMGGSASVNYVW
ncbi:MAG: YadA-like family protein, partial [Alcaligenaceae bacterium]|nr:YadA-like family protein [Alcaligenaceae bacterium]